MSWNIHDIMSSTEGLKTEAEDFTKTTKSHDIFCLQETKREVVYPNYRCFNKLRQDSRSGGICIGIHRSMSEGARVLETDCDDILAVKISTKGEELYIINTYDSPDESSFKKRTGNSDSETTLEKLICFINKMNFTPAHRVLLTGDFNARTRNCNHIVRGNSDTSPGEIIPDGLSGPVNDHERSSEDPVLNSRGELLLDFLACTNMSLLNGCTLGDVYGSVTCQTYNGSSVVDYVAVSPTLHTLVQSFKVLDMTMISDHRPCSTNLRITHLFSDAEKTLDAMEDAPNKYRWDNDSKTIGEDFAKDQLRGDIEQKAEEILRTVCHADDDVAKINSILVGVYNDIASNVIPRKGKPKQDTAKRTNSNRRIKPKQCWFDAECINAKRKLRSQAKRYGNNPADKQIRDEYYLIKRSYRQLTKDKKERYILELSSDIASGKNINWKRFKQLNRLKSTTTNLDVFDMKNFVTFFKDLYSKETLPRDKVDAFQSLMNNAKNNKINDLEDMLDCKIEIDELKTSIRSLKNAKACAEDLILN